MLDGSSETKRKSGTRNQNEGEQALPYAFAELRAKEKTQLKAMCRRLVFEGGVDVTYTVNKHNTLTAGITHSAGM